MEAIVINLSMSKKRRAFQKTQLQSLGLKYEILSATSIDDISDDDVSRHYYDWLRPLRKAEIACYFSHRRCWEKVIAKNKPMLILEDDALLSKKLISTLSCIKKYTEIDLIDLEVTDKKKNVAKTYKVINEESNLLKLHLNSSGAGGYVLFPSGAKKLLEHEKEKGISLADAHIANCKSLNAHQIEPALVVQLIMCQFYNIDNPNVIELCPSSTRAGELKKPELFFKFRRFKNEISLGLKKLKLLFLSKRRYIKIDKLDFS